MEVKKQYYGDTEYLTIKDKDHRVDIDFRSKKSVEQLLREALENIRPRKDNHGS